MTPLFLDVETRSELDLRSRPGHSPSSEQYAEHPSTRALVVCYAIGKGKIKTWWPLVETVPAALRDLTQYELVAHGDHFESAILPTVLGLTPGRTFCTAALARSHGLPGDLDTASLLLFGVGKDAEGKAVMLKLCKPRKPRKAERDFYEIVNEPPPVLFHEPTGEELEKLAYYCARDVELSRRIYYRLAHSNETERAVWELDRRANSEGVQIDVERVARLDRLMEGLIESAHKQARKMGLENLKSNDQFREWCAARGAWLDNCQAAYLREQADRFPEEIQKMIRLKLTVGKTSTAKLKTILSRVNAEGVTRQLLVYAGAHTLRWSGTGIQFQNFPRGSYPADEIESLLALPDAKLKAKVKGKLPALVSSALRSCLVPRKRKTLFVGDYAQIEARVNFWLAGEKRALEILASGGDLYKDMAATIYGVPIENVTEAMRQMGKQVILGCGFQMGASKFQATCANYGIEISLKDAEKIVAAYRKKYGKIRSLWYGLEQAAIEAVKAPGTVCRCGRIAYKFDAKRKVLMCSLPSGRVMRYQYACVTREKRFGKWADKLSHLSKNPLNHKWGVHPTYGGKLCENVVQATARDIMAAAMLRIDRGGVFRYLMSVHDEILTEAPRKASLKKFTEIMAEPPAWAAGLPIKVETWTGDRYKK